MTTPHDLEDAARDRFERAMSDTTAPADTLRTNAMAQGRGLRRRRRSLVAVGAVAAIAVTGFGVQYAAGGTQAEEANDFTQGGKPSTATRAEGTPSPSAGTPSLGPLEVPSGNPSSEPDGWWSMPASTMVTELRKLLPEGMQLTDPITMNEDRAPEEELHELEGYLTATLRPASGGPGKVNMVFYRPDDGVPAPPPSTDAEGNVDMFLDEPTQQHRLSCGPDAVTRPEDCEQLKAADGTVIGRVLDSTKGGVRSLSIDLATDDGGVVMVNVANTLDSKWPDGATPSAEKVPLTLAQLRSIADNPVWTSYRP